MSRASRNSYTGKRKGASLWLLAAVWTGCLLYMLFQGGKTSIMLFVMVTLLALYLLLGQLGKLLRYRGNRNLTLDVQQGPIQAGSQVRVEFHMDTPRLLPVPYMIVKELLQRHNGDSWSFEDSVVPRLRSGGELIYQTPPLERGRYTFADTVLAYEDIFGIMEHRRKISVSSTFQVLPRTIFIPRWSMYDHGFRLAGLESVHALSHRETTQINGIRDYIYGDRLSRIHWNATARTGNWMSKEYEHESMPKTIIVLDCSRDAYPDPEIFELAVSSAASLLEYGERRLLSMGLVTLNHNPALFPAKTGRGHHQEKLHHMVELASDGQGNGLSYLESRRNEFVPGMLFVYITARTGDSAMDILAFAKQRRTVPYLLHIGGREENSVSRWLSQLDQQGMRSTSVTKLAQLPEVLGGQGA